MTDGSVPEAFSELQARVFDLYGKGASREALDIVLRAREVFPERAGRISFWTGCLRSRLGELDEALEALEQAVEEGFWSPEMFRTDPDLEPLRGREDFRAVLAKCEHLREEAQAKARPELLVRTPPDYAADRRYPLLLALHGRGGNARDPLPHWSEALSAGLILALPQSSQVMGSESFSWDDPERARQELGDHYRALQRDHPVDTVRVVLAGYSQGGALALSLALQGDPVPPRAFILVAPSPLPAFGTLEAAIENATARGLQGWIWTGQRDPSLEATKELHRFLVEGGLDCQLHVEPDVGHEFPPDFASKLKSAVTFLV